MADEIKVGDIVYLNSGGPDMTVEKTYHGAGGEERATCQWFEGTKLQSGTFSVSALKKK
jgi:uncharacterized protein YodC (DUF2158 family)